MTRKKYPKLEKLSDIIPMLTEKSLKDIGVFYGKSEATMWRYVQKLRKAGFVVPTRRGREKLKI